MVHLRFDSGGIKVETALATREGVAVHRVEEVGIEKLFESVQCQAVCEGGGQKVQRGGGALGAERGVN